MNNLYEKMVETVLADKALNQDFPEFREVLSQGGQLYLFAFSEKLTELIVKECTQIAEETRWMVPPSQAQIAKSIKQHFGVE